MLYWASSPTEKIKKKPLIGHVTMKEPEYDLEGTIVPNGASYILAVSRNDLAEMEEGAALNFVDEVKPCLDKDEPSCVRAVLVSPDVDRDAFEMRASISVTRAPDEKDITHYVLYWGEDDCTIIHGSQRIAKIAVRHPRFFSQRHGLCCMSAV